MAKIIHGDKGIAFKVKANSLSRVVHNTIGKVAALLSSSVSTGSYLEPALPRVRVPKSLQNKWR